MHAAAHTPVGHRNPRLRRNADGRGNPRNLLTENPGGFERRHFLPSPAEEVRVAPLKAHHPKAGLRQPNQLLIDFLLRRGMRAAAFPHIDSLRGFRSRVQKRRINQIVIHHGLTLPKQPQAPQRNQIRLSAPGPYQRNAARRFTGYMLFRRDSA